MTMGKVTLNLSAELKSFDGKPIPYGEKNTSHTTVRGMLLLMIQERVGMEPDLVSEYALGKMIGESEDSVMLEGANLELARKIIKESERSILFRGQLMEMLQ